RLHRDVLPTETVRVAGAVERLVVMADVRQQRLARFDSPEQPGADVRVLAHLAYLVARQWTGLPHHSVAQADLADVVYESSDRGLDGALLVPANFARQE